MNSTPDISIITAVLNGAVHLDQCIRSVRSQCASVAVEHLVIDGASTDGTLDIIRSHADWLSHWQTGRDSGIADAMNKAIAHSRGAWLLFLQSDDFLIDSTVLGHALQRFGDDADIVGFPVLFGSDGKSSMVQARGANFWLNCKTGFNHQGTFIRRTLFDRIGLYDPEFKIAMDYEFFLRAYRNGARFTRYRSPAISVMRDTGISSKRDWSNLHRRFAEERRVHEKHQLPGMAPFYSAYWALYPIYREALSKLGR